MFFIGIFGIENKDKEIKIIDNVNCKICDSATKGKLIKNYSFFHFFFIPLFKWNENYYIVCSECNSLYTISKEKGKAIENGDNIEISYWDLQEVDNEHNNDNGYYEIKRCTYCGEQIKSQFKYCPHCGRQTK